MSRRPYGVMADLHCHAWSQFSTAEDGINSRLKDIIHEIGRCCTEVLAQGGNDVVIAGDVFHVRGKITPSVFNPVRQAIEKWAKRGITFRVIPGNHDLETEDSRELSSAVAMLAQKHWLVSHTEAPATLRKSWIRATVPWIKHQAKLLDTIALVASRCDDPSQVDLFIHAGIDGVLSGVPASGLTANKLAAFGFRRVFAGHYHHHAHLGQGVYSIGSPTHQTWSDVGTKSGWLIVSDAEVRWYASHAPNFIEITDKTEPDELPFIVDGHFVRARIGKATAAEVLHWREELQAMGAKGVLIQSTPAAAAVRTGIVSRLQSLPEILSAYCDADGQPAEVATEALEILGEVAA